MTNTIERQPFHFRKSSNCRGVFTIGGLDPFDIFQYVILHHSCGHNLYLKSSPTLVVFAHNDSPLKISPGQPIPITGADNVGVSVEQFMPEQFPGHDFDLHEPPAFVTTASCKTLEMRVVQHGRPPLRGFYCMADGHCKDKVLND